MEPRPWLTPEKRSISEHSQPPSALEQRKKENHVPWGVDLSIAAGCVEKSVSLPQLK